MFGIQPLIDQILSKSGITGAIIAVDMLPPTMLRFPYPIFEFKENEESNWESYTTPGGRNVFPAFVGMEANKVTFKGIWDLHNTNSLSYTDLGQQVQMIEETPYRGAHQIVVEASKLSGLDMISHVKSIVRLLKTPKYSIAYNFQAASGKILHVSQGTNAPSPPLCVFVKNPQEIFIGYVSKADVTETDHDYLGIATRVVVDFEFFVAPDFIMQTKRDTVDQIHAALSVLV